MKKYSRRERKIASIAKQEGYLKGYQQGLHDGNPFIVIGETVGKMISASLDALSNPALIEAYKEAQEEQKKIDSCVSCDHFGDCEECERSEEE